MTNITHISIHTDGACSGNPGPGGWSAIVRWHCSNSVVREAELCGGDAATTNNRMELSAVIAGLRHAIAEDPAINLPIIVNSDSEYVTLNAADRLPRWKRNGWRTADKKPVKNLDLWSTLDGICVGQQVSWQWVRGHNGDDLNERADALANAALVQFLPASAA